MPNRRSYRHASVSVKKPLIRRWSHTAYLPSVFSLILVNQVHQKESARAQNWEASHLADIANVRLCVKQCITNSSGCALVSVSSLVIRRPCDQHLLISGLLQWLGGRAFKPESLSYYSIFCKTKVCTWILKVRKGPKQNLFVILHCMQ